MADIFAVSGVKNSGKTTLLEGLIAALTARGHRVAVVKHDGHGFAPDTPGTDTARHLAAGACGTAVFDGEKYQLVRYVPVTEETLIALFPEADVVLLEGFKDSRWPKIEVVRRGNSQQPVCDPATLVALATDLPLRLEGVPTVGLTDSARLAELLEERMQGGGPS